MKIDTTKLFAIGGIILSLGGTLLAGVANEKKTEKILEKLVDEKLSQK